MNQDPFLEFSMRITPLISDKLSPSRTPLLFFTAMPSNWNPAACSFVMAQQANWDKLTIAWSAPALHTLECIPFVYFVTNSNQNIICFTYLLASVSASQIVFKLKNKSWRPLNKNSGQLEWVYLWSGLDWDKLFYFWACHSNVSLFDGEFYHVIVTTSYC